MNNTERVSGRIIKEQRHIYTIKFENKIITGEVSGAFHYKALNQADYPTIGDMVSFTLEGELGYIHEVLPRKTKLSRKVAGDETVEQIIATNMHKVILVFAIDGSRSFTTGGIDRYVSIAWDSGAIPVIVLNKEDLCEDLQEIEAKISEIAPGVEVYYTSAVTGQGIEELKSSICPGESFVFIGPSGAGKSSLINAIKGEDVMLTGGLRKGDGQGRHTTTHKEIITLENGTELYDCPGMREVQLWGDSSTLDDSFSDVIGFAEECKFNNCSHDTEPGCRIKDAIISGELSNERYKSYLKLLRELQHLERRKSSSPDYLEKQKWKKIYQDYANRDKVIY